MTTFSEPATKPFLVQTTYIIYNISTMISRLISYVMLVGGGNRPTMCTHSCLFVIGILRTYAITTLA